MVIKFELEKLPYKYNALEPFISEKTLKVHHDKHHQTYCDKFNAALEQFQIQGKNFEEIFSNVKDKTAIRNHGGGFWNHQFYFESLSGDFEEISNFEILNKKIIEDFGSFENFKQEFSSNAANLFGSGWTWLAVDKENKLTIYNTANQDNFMMDVCSNQEKPILVIDVWEHAYYIDSQNRRPEYISNFFNIINWKKVEERLINILKSN